MSHGLLLTRRQLVLLMLLTLMWGCNWPMMKAIAAATGLGTARGSENPAR